jgi:hypothetical protein
MEFLFCVLTHNFVGISVKILDRNVQCVARRPEHKELIQVRADCELFITDTFLYQFEFLIYCLETVFYSN